MPQWGIVVVAGETNIYKYHSIHRQIRNADQLVINPRFDMRTLANDIALVSVIISYLINIPASNMMSYKKSLRSV